MSDEGKPGGPADSGRRLTPEGRRLLLDLARQAIEEHLAGRRRAPLEPANLAPEVVRPAGCFVTLYHGQALRGCIGRISPHAPLVDAVAESAIAAATSDQRFPPVGPHELPLLTIHVSVLTAPVRLTCSSPAEIVDQLVPGTHGVILRCGWRTGVYLPQVWDRFADGPCRKEDFLASLSAKAGDRSGTLWRRPDACIEVFEADSFGEDDPDI